MGGVADFPKGRFKTPMTEEYYSDLDQTELCSPLEGSKYWSLIGSANWIVALGRFDIAFATSTLARYCAMPRLGHYKAAQRIFSYLRMLPSRKLLIDAGHPPVRDMIKLD